MKFRALAAVGAVLALGGCDPTTVVPLLQAGASVLLPDVSAVVTPKCADIAKGNAAVANLCLDATGQAISILDALAKSGVKAHLDGHRLVLDAVPHGGWGPVLKRLRRGV